MSKLYTACSSIYIYMYVWPAMMATANSPRLPNSHPISESVHFGLGSNHTFWAKLAFILHTAGLLHLQSSLFWKVGIMRLHAMAADFAKKHSLETRPGYSLSSRNQSLTGSGRQRGCASEGPSGATTSRLKPASTIPRHAPASGREGWEEHKENSLDNRTGYTTRTPQEEGHKKLHLVAYNCTLVKAGGHGVSQEYSELTAPAWSYPVTRGHIRNLRQTHMDRGE